MRVIFLIYNCFVYILCRTPSTIWAFKRCPPFFLGDDKLAKDRTFVVVGIVSGIILFITICVVSYFLARWVRVYLRAFSDLLYQLYLSFTRNNSIRYNGSLSDLLRWYMMLVIYYIQLSNVLVKQNLPHFFTCTYVTIVHNYVDMWISFH